MHDYTEHVREMQYTSHKKFSEGKQAHVEMEASKTNQTRWESMTPQHFHTIPTSSQAFLASNFKSLSEIGGRKHLEKRQAFSIVHNWSRMHIDTYTNIQYIYIYISRQSGRYYHKCRAGSN